MAGLWTRFVNCGLMAGLTVDRLRLFCRRGLLVGVAGAVICLMRLSAFGGTVSPNSCKLRVNEPAVVVTLQAQGARVLANYGSFQLLEVGPVAALKTRSHASVGTIQSDLIELNARRLDPRTSETRALRQSVGHFSGRRLHLVQFIGPVKSEWRSRLEQTGVRVIQFIPQNAYLVQGDALALGRLQTLAGVADFIQWEAAYTGDLKVHPDARTADASGRKRTPATDLFAVQLLEDAKANSTTLALVDSLKLAPLQRDVRVLGYRNLIVRLPASRLAELAAQPDVVSVQPYLPRRKWDERQDQILAGNLAGTAPAGPGYLAWLEREGFTQAQFVDSGFAVDITDSGLDNGSTAPSHCGLYEGGDGARPSRVIYNRLEGEPNPGSTIEGCDGHGTLNAHIVAGYNDSTNGFPHADAAGYHYGLGVCPFVKVGSSVVFDPAWFTNPNYLDLQSRAYRDGARISANSWGADTGGAYDMDSQAYDALVRDAQPADAAEAAEGNQEMVILFAAGNSGPGSQTISSPGSGKNVITVGAAENVHSHSSTNGGLDDFGNDGCNVADNGADSADDLAEFSGRGPCADGRVKPDVVAPGTHVTGGVTQAALSSLGTGLAADSFAATGVCALLGGGGRDNQASYFPVDQQFYTTSSGTSHSTPAVAGACALLRQRFINQGRRPPSPALTKALLVNSARYLAGDGAADTLPSPNQGMGEAYLGMALDATPRLLRDQLPADKFTATGEHRMFVATVADLSRPVRVTLAWTDAPGATFANAWNNDLDLTLAVNGQTYRGNFFQGAFSAPDGEADARNNVESVFLPAGVTGSIVVTITAANLNSDGVPNEEPAVDQDFALVVYNAVEAQVPVMVGGEMVLAAEGCTPTNGVVDPGETVSVSFTLRNVGLAATKDLKATLRSTGGIQAIQGQQDYGELSVEGGAVARTFSFTAHGECGSTVCATLALEDQGTNLGVATFQIPLGHSGPIFVENFDAVAAPALPAAWTTTASGSASVWATATQGGDSLPNVALATTPGAAGVADLTSPVISLPVYPAQLSFVHRYHTEEIFDGGVLEVKIGDGTFVDILSAGGSFLAGSYNQTLYVTDNPLGGRQAWTGDSRGYVTTIVDLPASAAGKRVQFRWRCGTDGAASIEGWCVDSISLRSRICCGDGLVGLPLLVAGGWTVAAENCGAANAAVDPGETVLLNLGIKNLGTATATNVVATLVDGGGVTASGPAQHYGLVPMSGALVCRPFALTATGTCGETVTATLRLQEGGANLGTVSFAIPLGRCGSILLENFDGVTPPSLPAGWTSVTSGAHQPWIVADASLQSVTNAAFAVAGSSAGWSALVSPVCMVPPREAQLSFRQSRNLATGESGGAYDAGALEIKIGEGDWTDITSAGGTFVTGEYAHFVDGEHGNPLGWRMAWGGTSFGFVPTVVNLPEASHGQPVQFRWLFGTDHTAGGEGWWIDSVDVTAQVCAEGPLGPLITTQPVARTTAVGENASFGVTAIGPGPLTYQWRFNGTNLLGATTDTCCLTNVDRSDAGDYSVVVANPASVVASANAQLTVLNPARPAIIARWDFNSAPSDADPGTGSTRPTLGQGVAVAIGGVTEGFRLGSQNDPATGNVDNSAWLLSGFPAQGAANKSAGASFEVNTVGWENIAVVWDQLVSSTASKYCRLQYSTDGTSYHDSPLATGMGAAASFETKSNNLAAILGAGDNATFAFRIVTEFENTATGIGNASYTTASAAGYASSGSLGLDLVTVWGQPITPPPPSVVLTVLGNASGGGLRFSVSGDVAVKCVVEASPDLMHWTPMVTNLIPFTFADAESVRSAQRFFRAKPLR